MLDDLRYTRHVVLKENLPVLIFLVVVLVAGVTYGTIAIKTLDYSMKADLADHLVAFLDGFDEELSLRGQSSFFSLLVYQIKIILLIWILGLSVIGLPFIPVILFLRGFVIGFTMGFLIEELAAAGFLFALASLLPQNFLLIPLYIFSGLISIAFAWNLLTALLSRRVVDFWQQFTGYSILMSICGTGFIFAALVEFFISPFLMNLAAGLLLKN